MGLRFPLVQILTTFLWLGILVFCWNNIQKFELFEPDTVPEARYAEVSPYQYGLTSITQPRFKDLAPVTKVYIGGDLLREWEVPAPGGKSVLRAQLFHSQQRFPLIYIRRQYNNSGTPIGKLEEMVADHVLVKLRSPPTQRKEFYAEIKRLGLSLRHEERLSGDFLVVCDPREVDAAIQLAEKLKKLPMVLQATPDYLSRSE